MRSPSLAGWTRLNADGGVMLVPPDQSIGFIRIRAREPLRPIAAIIEAYARLGLGGGAVALVRPPRILTTDEGEYAAVFELSQVDERPLRRTVGVVFGDEHTATIDGRVALAEEAPRFADLVERLTLAHALGLGGDRWRRYFYTPPSGWGGLERHRADVWLAPGYPRNSGTITVFHARPPQRTRPLQQHARIFEDLTHEFAGSETPPQPIQTTAGMVGQVVRFEAQIDGSLRRAANVGFADGRYLYFLRLETDETHREVNTTAFLRVARSIEALPWPRQDLGALVHWSD